MKAMSVTEDEQQTTVVSFVNDKEETGIINKQYKCGEEVVQNELNLNNENLSSNHLNDEIDVPLRLYSISAYTPGFFKRKFLLWIGLLSPFIDLTMDYLGIGKV